LQAQSPLRKSTRSPRGAGKARGKGAAPVDGEASQPKVPKMTLKTQVLKDIGGRDIAEVAAEARAKVAEAEQAIKAAESGESGVVNAKADLKLQVEATSQEVADIVEKETVALEKLREARQSHDIIRKETAELREKLLENQKIMSFLEAEGDNRSKVAEFNKARQSARDVADAASQAIAEQNKLEKEASENQKAMMKEHIQREQEMTKALLGDTTMDDKALRLDAKMKLKRAKQSMDDELKAFDRIRLDRLKRRATVKSRMGIKSTRGQASPAPQKRVKRSEVADVD